MPGTITFRPIEANLTHNTELLGKMSPYCSFIVGESVYKSQICKKGGKHPVWEDAVTIPVSNANQVIVEVMDKDKFTKDDVIGGFLLNLNEIQGTASRWYPLTYKNKPAGEILLETSFSGEGFSGRTGVMEEEIITTTKPAIIEEEIITTTQVPHERHIYQEQQQVVVPQTFVQEIDKVEIVPRQEVVQILEPQTVMKEVMATEIRPVTKTIEVVEPIVKKQTITVVEPRLVTKTIQVVEETEVQKEVEVVENVVRMEEVTTYEPTTVTKVLPTTEMVPVEKIVTVSEPVHKKEAVVYEQDIIETKTITKEILEPVVVDQQITTEIGPASVVGLAQTIHFTEEERLYRFGEWKRLRTLGYTDVELEKHFTTQKWGPISHYRFYEL